MARVEQQQRRDDVAGEHLLFPQLNNDTRWHSDLLMLKSAMKLLPIYLQLKEKNAGWCRVSALSVLIARVQTCGAASRS